MTHYVPDSTVLIEFSKGVEPTTSRVLELVAESAQLSICAVQVAEFYAGAPVGAFPAVDAFLRRLDFVLLTPEMAVAAGTFRRQALEAGRRLATPDALIAACAHHLGATVLTNNLRDFDKTGVATQQLGGEG